jgi:hypothetical protein
MPDEKKKGSYIPESVMTIVQGLMAAAMTAVWALIWNMHGDLSTLQTTDEAQKVTIAELKAELNERREAEASIQTSLAVIEAQLPDIKKGIDDIKSNL